MANRVCWNCSVAAHHTRHGDVKKSRDGRQYFAAYVCDECGVFSVGWISERAYNGSGMPAFMDRPDLDLNWEPNPPKGKKFPDVPEHIASAAGEAHKNFSIRNYRSAILMARSVVEATAKDMGIKKGNLASKIDDLHEAGHVREMVAETAHEIRFVGNDMAHGDFVTPVDLDEAEDVLHFMDELLNEVYQAPARLNARRSARQKKKEGDDAGDTPTDSAGA
ncbi:DUF4145 domain-containing protein [Isoptericola sp. NPDC055881]